jgi:site-specific recombinase XerD
MAVAGRMIVERKFHGGIQSQHDIAQRWAYFCKWVEKRGVRKMENLSHELVIQYGQQLQLEVDAGIRKTSSSPKNYVSAINTVMRLATNAAWKPVKPGNDCGIQPRVYISTESKAMSEARHAIAKMQVDERIACLLDLQRAFGLRFKESCLLNPAKALSQAYKQGNITLTDGTKGGKQRSVPCRPGSVAVLEMAVSMRNGRSMIPKGMTYVEFQRVCYEQANLAGISFHSERHYYAQERYKQITNAPSPIEAGWSRKTRILDLASYLNISEEDAKNLDHGARLQISTELGHNRVGITNVYIG